MYFEWDQSENGQRKHGIRVWVIEVGDLKKKVTDIV